MGTCTSSPRSRFSSRKHDQRRTNCYAPQYEADSVRRSVGMQIVSIVNKPSKDDVHARYNFGKELGRGEFGITYRCTDVDTGEQFACKTISKSKLRTEIDVEDVRREVEIMRHMPRHPNIVRFREAYEDKEAVYLVMELCEGGELFDRIVQSGHFTERAASKITKTIMEIVKVCHDQGVIHRDLKPENFLFANASESSPLKVIDFGLSTIFQSGQCFCEIVGSPYYMAPEVLRRNYGPEIDVWSAGVILYILLCGVPPFWAETEEGIAQAIMRGEFDFARDPWPKVSAEAKDLVKSMLNPNPYDRLTVQEVLGVSENTWIQNMEKDSNISLGENVGLRIKQFSLMNKFKKKVLRIVADNLSDEQVDSIKEMFDMMDTDKNGDLTFDELKHGLHSCGQHVQDQDVQMVMDAADVDGSGTINCEEFMTMSVHLRRIGSNKHLLQAFKFFDKNRTGYIEFNELKDALTEENLSLNNEQAIEDIIHDADLDKDGRISYDEFKAMMMTGMDWKMASRQFSRALLNALSMKMFKENSARNSKNNQTA